MRPKRDHSTGDRDCWTFGREFDCKETIQVGALVAVRKADPIKQEATDPLAARLVIGLSPSLKNKMN